MGFGFVAFVLDITVQFPCQQICACGCETSLERKQKGPKTPVGLCDHFTHFSCAGAPRGKGSYIWGACRHTPQMYEGPPCLAVSCVDGASLHASVQSVLLASCSVWTLSLHLIPLGLWCFFILPLIIFSELPWARNLHNVSVLMLKLIKLTCFHWLFLQMHCCHYACPGVPGTVAGPWALQWDRFTPGQSRNSWMVII